MKEAKWYRNDNPIRRKQPKAEIFWKYQAENEEMAKASKAKAVMKAHVFQ